VSATYVQVSLVLSEGVRVRGLFCGRQLNDEATDIRELEDDGNEGPSRF
jgi:hypothetical protein